jgi:hypothetical protein
MPSVRRERDRVSTVLGQWRATYTPGDWVLLSGPTSLVLMEPPVPERSSMINMLWQEVVASSSMSDLAARLATFPLDSLPSFAAFFWTENGMRSLVRGAVSVVDLGSGVTVAQGEGIQTWTEVGLQQVSQVLVEAQSRNGTQLELPLVVGAVRASSVRLDASPAARVSSPQRAAAPADVGPLDGAPGTGELVGGAPVGGAPVGAEIEAEPAPAELSELQPVAEAEAPDAWAGPDTELLADPFADEPELPPAPAEPAPVPVFAEPAPEPGPTEPAPARRMAADSALENADTTLMPPPYGPGAPEPVAPAAETGLSDNSLIMAVVCQYGHASPQNATHCRTCDSPIAPQSPQLVPRPVLAVLRSSGGTTAAVDRAVLIGRAPSAQRSSARAPRLMTLPSPGHDISRTHVEVVPEGWQIVVTDLHSTNGTVLVGPDGVDRQQLPPGEAIQVQLGSVIELGDGVSVLIDYPQ